MAVDVKGWVTVRVPTRIDFAGGWSDVHHFAAREGGAVLNAAIEPAVEGRARWDGAQLRVQYGLSLPSGSHLGTSGAIDVAWLALTKRLMGEELAASDLAELAYQLEELIGVEGGKQDQYAAALGGFNLLHFGAEDEPAAIEHLDVPAEIVQTLQASCILCDAGPSPAAGSIHTEVWQRYRQGDTTIARTLREIRDTVLPARDALLAGDVTLLASLVTANREAARQLHQQNVTPRMDELLLAGENAGALGSKACGEGGGGCLLFLCPSGRRTAVAHALRSHGGTLVPFRFAARREW